MARLAAFLVILLFLVPAALPAQSASSRTLFLVNGTQGPGGWTGSTRFRLTASFGSGVVAERANSPSYRILGGFNAAIEAPTTGRPWLTGVMPLYGPLLGGTVHNAHGTELHLGTATNLTIGGEAAASILRARYHARFILPRQSVPGWQPVTATNSGGVAFLPEGIGILPMIEKAHAIDIGQPFRITYRGAQGDLIYLAATGTLLPSPLPLPPYHYGLVVDFSSLLVIAGPLLVVDSGGEYHLDFPGIPLPRPLYLQMLSLPVGNPGYRPGSFTNVIAL